MICVYIIKHVLSGIYYIGCTSNFQRRQIEHRSRLRHGTHNSHLMQYAYGVDKTLTWETFPTETFADAMTLEREMIQKNKGDELMANHHMAKPMAEETKVAIAEGHKQYWTEEKRIEQGNRKRGTTHTDETKEKMRRSSVNKTISAEMRKKASDKNRKEISVAGVVYPTAQIAGRELGVDIGTVLNRARSIKDKWVDWFIVER